MVSDDEIARIAEGRTYAHDIKNWWLVIRDLSIHFNQKVLAYEEDEELKREYISHLVRFWMELYPKIKGRTEPDFQTFSTEYESFKKYYENPSLFIGDKNMKPELTMIPKMEMTLRIALEKLEITTWD